MTFFKDPEIINEKLVATIPIGQWDVRESVEKDGPEKFIKYTRQMLETITRKVREMYEKNNQPRGIRYTVICDYEGFGLRQLANMKS